MIAAANKFVRQEGDWDPEACQTSNCPYKRMPGGKYCPRHGGRPPNHPSFAISKYRLAQWQGRMEEMSGVQDHKDLREELGILRMSLEQVITTAHTAYEFVLASGRIMQLVKSINDTVSQIHRLEVHKGSHLDESSVLELADILGGIVAKYVTDPEILDRIGTDFGNALEQKMGSNADRFLESKVLDETESEADEVQHPDTERMGEEAESNGTGITISREMVLSTLSLAAPAPQ